MINFLSMSRAFTLLKNISSNFLTNFWLMIVGFITTPLILHLMGTSEYGILIIINTVGVYFSVIDFGLIPALIKYTSSMKAKNEKLEEIINTALTFYIGLSFFSSLIIFFSSHIFIYKLFNIPASLQKLAYSSMMLTSINFFISALVVFFSVLPQALHKFEINNLKNIISGSVTPIATLIILFFNKGIREIIISYIFINFLTLIIFFIITKNIFSDVNFRFNFSKKIFVKLFNFGFLKFITSLCSRVVNQLGQLLIGIFLPISYVSYYTISSGVAQKIVELLPNISSPLFPLSSELHSKDEVTKLNKLYFNATKLTNIIFIPLAGLIFIFAKPLLSIWIGISFANNTYIILRILSIAYLINSFSGIPAIIVEGVGKPKISTIFAIISAFLYVILSLIFIPKLGLTGAALALLINSLFITPIFIYYINTKILQIKNLKIYFDLYLLPIILVLICDTIIYSLKVNVVNLGQLIFYSLIYYCFFIILSLMVKLINKNDINNLTNIVLKRKSL